MKQLTIQFDERVYSRLKSLVRVTLLCGEPNLFLGIVSDIILAIESGEDVFGYLRRRYGKHQPARYKGILGAANAFKEGDQIVGVAAADETSRTNARKLLANTRVGDIDAHPPHQDQLFALLKNALDDKSRAKTEGFTLGELKRFLLTQHEEAIKSLVEGGFATMEQITTKGRPRTVFKMIKGDVK